MGFHLSSPFLKNQNYLYLAWLLSFIEKNEFLWSLSRSLGSIAGEKSSWLVSSLGPRGSFLFFYRRSAGAFARKPESLKRSRKMFPQAKRPWLRTQTATFLLGRREEPPEIRHVVIWKIIANFFHPPVVYVLHIYYVMKSSPILCSGCYY